MTRLQRVLAARALEAGLASAVIESRLKLPEGTVEAWLKKRTARLAASALRRREREIKEAAFGSRKSMDAEKLAELRALAEKEREHARSTGDSSLHEVATWACRKSW